MSEEKRKKISPGALLIAALFAMSLIWPAVFFLVAGQGEKVRVSVDGRITGEYPLMTDRSVRIEGAGGGYNVLVIEKGRAYVSQADCPDGLCRAMGEISRGGQSVVCLPHRVVIEIVSAHADEVPDTITR